MTVCGALTCQTFPSIVLTVLTYEAVVVMMVSVSFIPGFQVVHAHFPAVDVELVGIGYDQVFNSAIFELENKIIALNVNHFCVPHLSLERRRPVLNGCGAYILSPNTDCQYRHTKT